MEYTIYVITNEVNGKEYVGVTSDLKRRWRRHRGRARRGHNEHLYNAMRKHGADQFSIQPVEHVEAREQAFDVEKQWIADLDTYQGEGYNMTPGGDSGPEMTGERNPMYGRTGEDHPSHGHRLSGEDHPMHGRTGEDHPAHGHRLSGEDHPMHGRTGEDNPMHGRGNLVSGENNGMHGRTGEDNPMHARTGEAHPQSKLTNNEASALKWYALNSILSQREIGQMFGVSRGSVGKIARGDRWPNLDPKPPADNGQLRLPLGAT